MFARIKRLTLRPFWPEDAETLTGAIAHREVATRLARMPWPYGVGDAHAYLAHAVTGHEPRFAILAHDAAPAPVLVGSIALSVAADGVHELGYWLTPGAWGRGYATEAGHAVLDAARHALGVRRVRAYHHADNPASGAVLRKLGFRQVRRLLRFSLAAGGEVDSVEHARDLVHDSPDAMRAAA